jgi:hypothetical protein
MVRSWRFWWCSSLASLLRQSRVVGVAQLAKSTTFRE